MKAAIFLALAVALPSTAAFATIVRQNTDTALTEAAGRKAGGCTACACCDFITLGGLGVRLADPVAAGSSRRD